MKEPRRAPSYRHEHRGVLDLGWARFGELCRTLVEKIVVEYEPDVVVGIAKGGVLPAVVVSSALMRDFFPIKLSSRENEVVVRESPRVFVAPGPEVEGKRVLLVDDICVTARTLELARELLIGAGAAQVRTATFAVHGGARPDWYALETEALLLFPWDRDIYTGEGWSLQPEYAEELVRMGMPDQVAPQPGATS